MNREAAHWSRPERVRLSRAAAAPTNSKAPMSQLEQAMIYATIAGATMPLGAILARFEHIRPRWLETEIRHSVIAFGGGVLLAAVALVLVPKGLESLPTGLVVLAFGMGGLAFFFLDRAIARSGWSASQLIAMLLDFVPEALALGALLATGERAGLLLVILIALQNFPEGFNAYRELVAKGAHRAILVLWSFSGLVLLGPLSAYIGHTYLSAHPSALGAVMMFAGAGILYLTFQDIAPQAHLKRHWAPPLGAVAGFLVGLIGQMLIA